MFLPSGITVVLAGIQITLTYISSCNLTPPIYLVLIGRHLIFFSQSRDQRAVTRLENIRQLNIRRDKKLSFQLSHAQPLDVQLYKVV